MSKHVDSKLLVLYMLDELDESNYRPVQAHLETCDACRHSLSELQNWKEQISDTPKLQPGYQVLMHSRRQLMEKIQNKGHCDASSVFGKINSFLMWSPSQPKWAMVAVVFVFGLVLGNWNQIFSSKQSIVRDIANQSAYMTGHFRVEGIDGEPGDLKVQFSSIKNHVVQGNIQDPEIQYLLSHALVNLDQDNVRLKCVNLLQQAAKGQMVQNALYHAVQRDENPGVRLKAIRILKHLPLTDSLKKVLLQVFFQDKNTGIRLEAKEALEGRVAPQILETFQVKIEDGSSELKDSNLNSKILSM